MADANRGHDIGRVRTADARAESREIVTRGGGLWLAEGKAAPRLWAGIEQNTLPGDVF